MRYIFAVLVFIFHLNASQVSSGVDVFFDRGVDALKGKKIGLIINQTSVNSRFESTLSLFQKANLEIVAIFTPEHGLNGRQYASEHIDHGDEKGIPVYSLHGETRRPQLKMLKGIDLLIYDIQCTGVRAYTYETTLFYVMEEAAKLEIKVIVLDRPNPINGITVDGPMLDEKWRSFIGYLNVPYCHGMTIGELSKFFNDTYKIGCNLEVVRMLGWSRSMSYSDTGLAWIPPSPNVPEADTPLYCPATGLLGELKIANIGIGFTLPFKIVGAPWIKAQEFSEKLNAQNLPGVHFQPFYFRPFWGLYKGVDCEGVLIRISDPKKYRPLAVQYLLMGMLKSLYPKDFQKRIEASKASKELFCKANGTHEIYEILVSEKYPAWKLIEFQKKERDQFRETRKKYLLYD